MPPELLTPGLPCKGSIPHDGGVPGQSVERWRLGLVPESLGVHLLSETRCALLMIHLLRRSNGHGRITLAIVDLEARVLQLLGNYGLTKILRLYSSPRQLLTVGRILRDSIQAVLNAVLELGRTAVVLSHVGGCVVNALPTRLRD